MEHRRLGSTGLYVSEVGLGCNNFGGRLDQAATEQVVHAALDHGITLFDTADIYGGSDSEVFVGSALGSRRKEVVVATKFGLPMGEGLLLKGGSRRYIFNAVEDSLSRLQTDYIDLYQMHFPDPSTPIEETLRALDDLISQGKVRYIGCSNFLGYQIADAAWIASKHHLNPFVSAQNHMNLFERATLPEIIPACEHFGLGQLPYFPLASGLLTGKYKRDMPPPANARLSTGSRSAQAALSESNFARIDALTAFAKDRNRSLIELAFGWLLSFPEVSSVIAGATSSEQITSNVENSTLRLDAGEMAEVLELLKE